jgi:N-methylhydantoinase A
VGGASALKGVERTVAPERHEQVFFDGGWHETGIYDREALTPGHHLDGPAIVVQKDTTIVVEPGYRGATDSFGNLVIRQMEGGQR